MPAVAERRNAVTTIWQNSNPTVQPNVIEDKRPMWSS
jgi:hypothetical protein